MTVDNILHEKLNNYELMKTLNKSFVLALIGKAGSGKSHFLISMLNSKPLFNRVFENIMIFIPPSSRSSIKDDFWDENLSPENSFDELNLYSLENACKENADEGYKSLLIFDDVHKDLRANVKKCYNIFVIIEDTTEFQLFIVFNHIKP